MSMATLPENYLFVCKQSDLPARGKKKLEINGISVLIIVCDSGLYAIENRCPQTTLPLVRSKVLGKEITSPTGARYDLRTGQYIAGGQSPFQSHWLTVFPLQVVGDDIYIKLPQP
jgi:3-phenylpropionate/trans-cinnamate dioxygenase ferredoxin component